MIDYSYNCPTPTRKEIITFVHFMRTHHEDYEENFTLSDEQLNSAWKRSLLFRTAIKELGGKRTNNKIVFPNIFARRVVCDWLQQFKNADLWNICSQKSNFEIYISEWSIVDTLCQSGTIKELQDFLKRIARRENYQTIKDIAIHFGGTVAEKAFTYRNSNLPYLHFINQPLKKVW